MNELTTLQRALITIKKLKKQLSDHKTLSQDPIAIVGLSCRFPEANNKEAYWELLKQGRNSIASMPEERWQLLKGTNEFDMRDPKLNYSGGYFKNITDFDAYFFGISPREAIRMDPQQRLLLEVAYESIEDAGIPIEQLSGSKTGIFASLYTSHYGHLQTLEDEKDALYFPTGNALSIAANRLSYLLDLQGPSVVIDTACSSSLVAIHEACLHLREKLCEQALVCSVNINLLPSIHALLYKAKMLSPTGQCKTFDTSADGYVQGEGAASIVLKPLNKALENNDRIYAVICASGVNQDGKTNGLTAPNGLQQEKLLHEVYSQFQINPEEISYIEAHGTGTFLGDPIELEALGKVLGKRDAKKPCWVGSVKTNIGHLEPAAGLASIVKVALAMQHKKIPPHLNVTQLNPHIDFNQYHLQIPKQLQEWPCYGDYRMAGISGFGFGGTNAHVVLRDLNSNEVPTFSSSETSKPNLFVLSAKDSNALKQLMKNWLAFLKNENKLISLQQLCYNLQKRRSLYQYRLSLTVCSIDELMTLLQEALDKPLPQANIPINWDEYKSEESYRHCDMPLYPWQHKAYWPVLSQNQKNTTKLTYPLQGHSVSSPLQTQQFEFQFDTDTMPEIKDTFHILHAGYYLEMLAFAVDKLRAQADNSFSVRNLEYISPLLVLDKSKVKVQLILEALDSNHFSCNFFSLTNESQNWIQHARGELTTSFNLQNSESSKMPLIDSFDSIKKRCVTSGDKSNFYDRIVSMGMPAGDSIRWAQQYFLGKNEILCELESPLRNVNHDQFALKIHLGIVDGCIQSLFMMLPNHIMKPYVASHLGQISYNPHSYKKLYLYAVLNEVTGDGKKIKGSWYLLNENHQILIMCKDVILTQYNNKIHIQDVMKTRKEVYEFDHTLSLENQIKKISSFLLKEAAEIFSMPASDIDIDQSLNSLGMDSLMALTFVRVVETSFELTYSLNDIMQAQSISGIAKSIVTIKQLSTPTTSIKSNYSWIVHRVKRPLATTRLFCLPYGGAGASIYRDWHKQFPENIEVCPIQLPGREERMSEVPIHQMDILINRLYESIQSELDLPFAFFGHSFGSLIAFEFTRFLRRNQFPSPSHLFVSAYPDPKLPSKSLNKLLSELKTLDINLFDLNESALERITDKQLSLLSTIFSDNGIIGYSADKSNNQKMEKDIVKVLLPIFIGDMSLVKNYCYSEEAPLDIPITVFLGTQDQWVPMEDHLSWPEHSSQTCEIHRFDSGHLFIKDKEICSRMIQTISHSLIKTPSFIS